MKTKKKINEVFTEKVLTGFRNGQLGLVGIYEHSKVAHVTNNIRLVGASLFVLGHNFDYYNDYCTVDTELDNNKQIITLHQSRFIPDLQIGIVALLPCNII